MFMPGVLARQTVTVEPYEGDGAYGPVYGPQRTIQCRKDDTRRVVRDANGVEVTSDVTLWVPTNQKPLKTEDRVTLPDGRTTRVLVTKVHHAISRPAMREVVLA